MKIAILGAVFGTSENERLIFETYKAAALIKKEDAEIVSPNKILEHKGEYKKNHPDAPNEKILEDMVDFDLAEVLGCDIVLADVSLRSTGLGMELAYLKMNKKNSCKLFLFAKEGYDVSDMVKGAFVGNKIITYTSAEDLAEILDKIL